MTGRIRGDAGGSRNVSVTGDVSGSLNAATGDYSTAVTNVNAPATGDQAVAMLRVELAKARGILAAFANNETAVRGEEAIAGIESELSAPKDRGVIVKALGVLRGMAPTVIALGGIVDAIEEICRHL
jgi:hypothetical protein